MRASSPVTAAADAAYFDRLYAANPDPWGFATSPYERRKYRASLRALGEAEAIRATGAAKAADGSLTAGRLLVGKDGTTPPM